MSETNSSNPSSWQKLYKAVLVETNRDRLFDLAEALESAIIRRQQELIDCEGADGEGAAMVAAAEHLLSTKTAKLGWPRLRLDSVRRLGSFHSEPPTTVEKIQRVVSIHHWRR